MEGPGDTEDRSEGGENHQTAAVIDAVHNEGDDDDEGDDNEMEGLSEQEIVAEQDTDPKQPFIVDYCKKGTTKCRRCKKNIPLAALRIGKLAKFKTKDIFHYFHVTCVFKGAIVDTWGGGLEPRRGGSL